MNPWVCSKYRDKRRFPTLRDKGSESPSTHLVLGKRDGSLRGGENARRVVPILETINDHEELLLVEKLLNFWRPRGTPVRFDLVVDLLPHVIVKSLTSLENVLNPDVVALVAQLLNLLV